MVLVLQTPRDFYPRSPCGERREYWVGGYGTANNFYPRSPCGERPLKNAITAVPQQISIHALLAESDFHRKRRPVFDDISIHALLAESDYVPFTMPDLGKGFLSTLSLRRATRSSAKYDGTISISIHALLAESDVATVGLNLVGQIFLSTLSLRRATALEGVVTLQQYDFYPRSPCGERRLYGFTNLSVAKYFYPRSPCGERPT